MKMVPQKLPVWIVAGFFCSLLGPFKTQKVKAINFLFAEKLSLLNCALSINTELHNQSWCQWSAEHCSNVMLCMFIVLWHWHFFNCTVVLHGNVSSGVASHNEFVVWIYI